MAFDKCVEARILGVTAQNSDVRLTQDTWGDSSGGTLTPIKNPLRGTLMWDKCMYFLTGVSVAGGPIGGSYTVQIETTVDGYANLPIARVTGIGPLSPAVVQLTSLHNSPSSPLPTSVYINQTAAGGGLWAQLHCIAKQYRGVLGTASNKNAERVLQGTMLRGNSSTKDFSGDEGVSADTTFVLGTSGSDLGMGRIRLWDTAFYWALTGVTNAGTHDVDIIATIGGTTATIARSGTTGVVAGNQSAAALSSLYGGQSPNPSQIIWSVVTAGGISDFKILMMAKTGRGSMAKS